MTVDYVLISRAGQPPLSVRLHVQATRIFMAVGSEQFVVARRRIIHPGSHAQAWFVSQGDQEAVRIARKPDAIKYVVAEVPRRLGGVLRRVRRPIVVK